MNQKHIKILLILLSAVYVLSFLEVSDVERNQNYGNEEHSYVVSSDQSYSRIEIQKTQDPLFHIISGIDNQLPLSFHSYISLNVTRTVYSPQKIYITNSIFLI